LLCERFFHGLVDVLLCVNSVRVFRNHLVVVGFVIGILGGFFGVGGSFIAGPALRLMGVDWNYAVGTDLAHIVGKSIVAARKHRSLGNVDLKLGLIMAVGTIVGAFLGVLFMALLQNAMIIAGINPFWQLIVVGIVLLISVGLDQFARVRSRM